jgi:hypothetical protein
VDAGDYTGVISGEADADRRPDVLALGAEPRVAQGLGHQLRPQACPVAGGGRARRAGGRGEGETRQRGDHHVEAVALVASVRGRVGQQRRELEQLSERARPAVGEHQREWARAPSPLVHEVHPLAADVGGELGEGVQLLLLRPPVERRRPVGRQLF